MAIRWTAAVAPVGNGPAIEQDGGQMPTTRDGNRPAPIRYRDAPNSVAHVMLRDPNIAPSTMSSR